MDPISAAGFASAVLTFVEFSCKLIKGSYDIYHSDTKAPAETASISVVLKDLDDVTETLRGDCHGASRHRDFLKDLASQCLAVSGELSALLKDLERKEGNKVWRSVEAKWNMMRKEKDMASLEQRLGSLRQQLILRLTTIMSEEQSSLAVTLDKMDAGNVSLHSKTVGELKAIQESIQQLNTTLTTQFPEASDATITDQSVPLAEIKQVLSSILARLDASKIEQNILHRLHFPQIWTRKESVGNAEFDTFNWFLDLGLDVGMNVKTPDDFEHSLLAETERDALEQARRQFLEWLETGSLAYHISGKPGSGKSTLMKFLFQHPRVEELLQQWAGSRKLVMAGFFFWSSGTREEKSLRGLYQSLLFQVLRQCPELLQHTFPRDWAKGSDTPDNVDTTPFQLWELKRAMKLLVSQHLNTGHRFVFFIDGLDEFQVDLNTDHRDLAEDVLSWAQSCDVKLCLSSRPYPEFMEKFPARQRIALHDLTKADLRRFVSGALSKETASDEEVSTLSRKVTDRADGVFLWVRLVVRSVVEGIRHRYPLATLKQRVDGLPRGLEPLYVQLFESIDPLDRPRSDMIFLVALSTNSPLNALIYSWIDDLLDSGFPFNLPIRPCTEEEVLSRHENVKFQLYGLSKGLLETRQQPTDAGRGYDPPYFRLRVDFMHRTVRDFLIKPKMVEKMARRRFGSENALLLVHRSLHRLFLAEFKFGPNVNGPVPRGNPLASAFGQRLRVRLPYENRDVESKVLEDEGRVLSHHAQKSTSALPRGQTIRAGPYFRHDLTTFVLTRDEFSHNLYMAADPDCHDYMRSFVAKMPKDLLVREGPSLLLTSIYAVIGWSGKLSRKPRAGYDPLYGHLLEAGVSPNGECSVLTERPGSSNTNLTVTPWLALLQLRANHLLQCAYPRETYHTQEKDTFGPIVEAMLAFGADPDVFLDFSLHPAKDVADFPRAIWSEYLEGANIEWVNLVSVSLEDLILVDRPSNQAAVLGQISARRGGWLWESMKHAAEMLLPWVGVRFGVPKLEPAHRRISPAELEEYLKARHRLRPRSVYTRSHDITNLDICILY